MIFVGIDVAKDKQFYNTATAVNSKRVLVQEFIAGPECEVLVVKYQGQYLALDPVEIVFPDDQEFMDSEISNSYRYTFKLLEGAAAKVVPIKIVNIQITNIRYILAGHLTF